MHIVPSDPTSEFVRPWHFGIHDAIVVWMATSSFLCVCGGQFFVQCMADSNLVGGNSYGVTRHIMY